MTARLYRAVASPCSADRMRELRGTGLSLIVIVKEVDTLADFANRHFVIETGEVVWTRNSTPCEQPPRVHDKYLSV